MSMKKMLFVLSVLTFFGYIIFAGKASVASGDLQTVKGTIESISIGSGPLGGNKSEIVITDHKGQQMKFSVRTGIGIAVSGKEKLVSLKYLMAGDVVNMDYIVNRDGTNRVMTIELYNAQKR